ncbi:putative phosphoesterase [Ruegeria intermedia]|uniref:Putative phosphoesterase n=1 Tax=Ruegeria intermedia TaxID=996115 RepID=A0A1M4X2L7_9RHOB|nr:ligase-associated DNA damage response endonuclease PdeM [Ruegeria intermedia]SHE87573.1 putative phosphoesterase [Ruegeria intermedia]
MNSLAFSFSGVRLHALGSGALWWPDHDLLCVSDLHLGKSARMARRGAPALPPYETRDTLARLAADLKRTGAKTVICLGDSFDDIEAADTLHETDRLQIPALQAGRMWIWIEGNHDPGPVSLGGTHLAEWRRAPLVFRHIAQNDARGEVSGHYHPKVRLQARGRSITRPAFLFDDRRLILPAYGTYTGGLRSSDTALSGLMGPDARAILTGEQPRLTAMPR